MKFNLEDAMSELQKEGIFYSEKVIDEKLMKKHNIVQYHYNELFPACVFYLNEEGVKNMSLKPVCDFCGDLGLSDEDGDSLLEDSILNMLLPYEDPWVYNEDISALYALKNFNETKLVNTQVSESLKYADLVYTFGYGYCLALSIMAYKMGIAKDIYAVIDDKDTFIHSLIELENGKIVDIFKVLDSKDDIEEHIIDKFKEGKYKILSKGESRSFYRRLFKIDYLVNDSDIYKYLIKNLDDYYGLLTNEAGEQLLKGAKAYLKNIKTTL